MTKTSLKPESGSHKVSTELDKLAPKQPATKLQSDLPPKPVARDARLKHSLNVHEQFASLEFKESTQQEDGVPTWVECTIHRWDRRVPTTVREHLCEVRGTGSAWITHPRRMLRHKAMVQCVRITLGMGDVVDPDEAQRILIARDHAPKASAEQRQQEPSPRARRGPSSVRDLRQALGVQ